jgi:sigma-E factor negative regulatory protein RseA
MDTKEMTQEQVSAFADGELTVGHVDIALAALYQEAGRARWDVYHQISDVLHSDDLPCKMSSDFSSRFAARLAAEPTMVAPAISRRFIIEDHEEVDGSLKHGRTMHVGTKLKRFAISGIATVAAAAAGLAFFAAPQLMVAKLEPSVTGANVPVLVAAVSPSPGGASQDVDMKMGAQGGVMLRDSNIDEYLSAHQRFSPSVYGTAQYARAATFVTDSEK